MTQVDSSGPKLLFLLSTDHGELFNAMYFLLGTGLRGVIVMPPKLLALNERDFPYPVYGFRSPEEFLEIVDREEPDLVLLFSGYLYVINHLFDLDGFDRLVEGLRVRGLRVVTTDPSVGVMSRVDGETFHPSNPGSTWLRQLCPHLFERLRGYVHLYLAPELETRVRHVSFFNPAILPDAGGMQRIRERLARWRPVSEAKARWLFVLSAEDHAVQLASHGADAFTGQLAERLRDAARAGRQPILIAPRTCVARIRQQGERVGDLVALSACNYTLFMSLLYEAEHVFYWNSFSASIVARVLARRPFFLLDRGHLARTMAPFFEVGMRHFFQGCRLSVIDPERSLGSKLLAEEATRQETEVFDPIWRNLSRSPGPAAVVSTLL